MPKGVPKTKGEKIGDKFFSSRARRTAHDRHSSPLTAGAIAS
jgi:hypothetical protein